MFGVELVWAYQAKCCQLVYVVFHLLYPEVYIAMRFDIRGGPKMRTTDGLG